MKNDEQVQQTIVQIETWLKKFSVIFVRHRNWSISIVNEWKMDSLDSLEYPVSYDCRNNENAMAVVEYFGEKGTKLGPISTTGRWVYISKR